MNNYYYLIYLINELNKKKIIGSRFQFAISPHKNVLECYVENSETYRLIFSANPVETAFFFDQYRPPKKQNVFDFFKSLNDKTIVNISLANYDRLLSIHFEEDLQLIFKLFGNHSNALLVRDDLIMGAFKNPEALKGEPAPQPQVPNFDQKINSGAKAKNQISKINPLLPRNLLPHLIRQHRVDEMTVDEVKRFTQKITEALENDPHPRVLETGDVCLWSEEILSIPTDKSFNSVNNCIRYAYRNMVHLRRLHQKKERLRQFMEQFFSKKEAQHEQLQQADKSLERADEYEKYGHLLMANAHKSVQPGTELIEVEDFYENNVLVKIPLKEGVSIAENAERYYDKAKSSRTSYEKAKERAPLVKQEKEKAEALLGELDEIKKLYNLKEWIKKNKAMLEKFGYGTEDEGQAESPFRKFKIGKYEVWIGKNAKSNDELTSRAHKEDIWLHARGVSGSHAVIRMGNEKSYPPKKVILQAAAYAAYYSKARGMKTAPVTYTKRKYIHKPKGAAPGAVVIDRDEEVEMVPPRKPE